MSQVQFEENNYASSRFDEFSVKTSVLVKFLLKIGLVKTEIQANYVLIGIVVCASLSAFVVFYRAVNVSPPLNQNVLLLKAANMDTLQQR